MIQDILSYVLLVPYPSTTSSSTRLQARCRYLRESDDIMWRGPGIKVLALKFRHQGLGLWNQELAIQGEVEAHTLRYDFYLMVVNSPTCV